MAGSITLLPAVIGLLGDRIRTTRVRGMVAAALIAIALLGVGTGFRLLLVGIPAAVIVLVAGAFRIQANPLRRTVRHREAKPLRETGWYRLSRMVQSRPWQFAIGGTAVLLVLAAPVLGLRLGFSDEGNFAEETTTRKAYDLISEGFGPGANGPLLVVAEVSGPQDLAALNELSGGVEPHRGRRLRLARCAQSRRSGRSDPVAAHHRPPGCGHRGPGASDPGRSRTPDSRRHRR